jgi:hypothetical protein
MKNTKKNIANFVLIVFLSLNKKIQISTYRTTSFEQKKKESLLDKFLDELNPVNQASAFASKNIDKLETYSLYRRNLLEKSDEEIIALVINKRTEAAMEFQRSVEQSLQQLSQISSEFDSSSQKRRKMSLKMTLCYFLKWDVLDCSSGNFDYIIY